jgi:hypothetical protein
VIKAYRLLVHILNTEMLLDGGEETADHFIL